MLWEKLNLLYLLVFGYNMGGQNLPLKKLTIFLFWILLPTIILLSIFEVSPYEKGDARIFTTEITRENKLRVDFEFNRKLYSCISDKVLITEPDSMYLIYQKNAYGLKLYKRMILVDKNIKDTVKVNIRSKQFFPVDF